MTNELKKERRRYGKLDNVMLTKEVKYPEILTDIFLIEIYPLGRCEADRLWNV